MKKYIRESGIVPAPEGFTKDVMDQIHAEPVRKRFRPLIGKTGRVLILLSVIAIILVSVFYPGPGTQASGFRWPEFALDLQFPENLSFNLQFLRDMDLTTGLIAALAAIFILVLSDAGLSRKRLA